MTRRGDWGTTRACWEARDIIWSLDDAGRSSGATSFAEPQRPAIGGRPAAWPRRTWRRATIEDSGRAAPQTAAGRGPTPVIAGVSSAGLAVPRPPRMYSSSCVSTCRRWVAWCCSASANTAPEGAASTQAGSFRWEAEAGALLLDAPACSWQQPESRLLRRASHRGTQGPTRPPNHSVQTGPPHRERPGGVYTERADRGRKQGRKSLKPRQRSMI